MSGFEVPAGIVTAVAEAMEDAAMRWIGRDLGTVHRDDIARAMLDALLADSSFLPWLLQQNGYEQRIYEGAEQENGEVWGLHQHRQGGAGE